MGKSFSVAAAVGLAVILACAGSATPTSPKSPDAGATLASTAAPSIIRHSPAAPITALGASIAPMGLAFDTDGSLFVSECSWTVAYIDRISPDGSLTRIAGTGELGFQGDGGPAIDAEFRCPAMIAFGPDRGLYIADHANNRVRRIDSTGMISTVAGSGPTGINLGSFSGDGGSATDATLQEPWGIAFDASGNLYIGDRDNYRVRRVDPAGVITTVAGGGHDPYASDQGPATDRIVAPLGIAIDPQGRLVIADQANNRVRRVDQGMVSTIAGTGNHVSTGDGRIATAADIYEPGHVAIDSTGALLIQSGTQIRRIDDSGVISTIIGSGKAGVFTNGMAALDAPFPELWGIAVDAAGNIYVADDLTSVYRIDRSGLIRVFAGVRV